MSAFGTEKRAATVNIVIGIAVAIAIVNAETTWGRLGLVFILIMVLSGFATLGFSALAGMIGRIFR